MSNPSKTNFCALSLLASIAWLGLVTPARAYDDQQSGAIRTGDPTALASESWQQTMHRLDEWFSVQPIYDQKEVEVVKKDLSHRLESITSADRDAFREDLDTKLEMVLGPEGRDILGWVAASWAAASPAYRKKLDVHYPDLMKLTAAQLRQQLDLLERKREAARSQTAKLEQFRQARIAALQADAYQQSQERERALDRGAASAAYRTPYHPQGVRQYPDVVARSYFNWGFGFF